MSLIAESQAGGSTSRSANGSSTRSSGKGILGSAISGSRYDTLSEAKQLTDKYGPIAKGVGSAVATGALGAGAWVLGKSADVVVGTGASVAKGIVIGAAVIGAKGAAKVGKKANEYNPYLPTSKQYKAIYDVQEGKLGPLGKAAAVGTLVGADVNQQFVETLKPIVAEGVKRVATPISEKSKDTLAYVFEVTGDRVRDSTVAERASNFMDTSQEVEVKPWYDRKDVQKYIDEYSEFRTTVDPHDVEVNNRVVDVEEAVAKREQSETTGEFDSPEEPSGAEETGRSSRPSDPSEEVEVEMEPENDFRQTDGPNGEIYVKKKRKTRNGRKLRRK